MSKPKQAKVTKSISDTIIEHAYVSFFPFGDKITVSLGSETEAGSIETLIDTPGVSVNMNQFDKLIREAIKLTHNLTDEDIED